MEKQQEASAPPNFGDAPPPYPGTGVGGFAPPPAGQYAPPPGQYPPQPPGYVQGQPPTQPPPQQIVIVQGAINYGKHPMTMTCPHCQSQIQTSIRSEPGPMAWIVGGILCFFGFWCCACIPCCIDDLNQVEHKCPNCNAFLGRYKGGM
jgi:lipopolysaccharide-induced tumor necrosis factor-alpha factor